MLINLELINLQNLTNKLSEKISIIFNLIRYSKQEVKNVIFHIFVPTSDKTILEIGLKEYLTTLRVDRLNRLIVLKGKNIVFMGRIIPYLQRHVT